MNNSESATLHSAKHETYSCSPARWGHKNNFFKCIFSLVKRSLSFYTYCIIEVYVPDYSLGPSEVRRTRCMSAWTTSLWCQITVLVTVGIYMGSAQAGSAYFVTYRDPFLWLFYSYQWHITTPGRGHFLMLSFNVHCNTHQEKVFFFGIHE